LGHALPIIAHQLVVDQAALQSEPLFLAPVSFFFAAFCGVGMAYLAAPRVRMRFMIIMLLFGGVLTASQLWPDSATPRALPTPAVLFSAGLAGALLAVALCWVHSGRQREVPNKPLRPPSGPQDGPLRR